MVYRTDSPDFEERTREGLYERVAICSKAKVQRPLKREGLHSKDHLSGKGWAVSIQAYLSIFSRNRCSQLERVCYNSAAAQEYNR